MHENPQWHRPCGSINGAGVEFMQAKWDEMFGEKKEEVLEEVKVRKPRKKAVAKTLPSKGKLSVKKPTAKKTTAKKVVKKTNKSVAKKKPAALKAAVKKSPSR